MGLSVCATSRIFEVRKMPNTAMNVAEMKKLTFCVSTLLLLISLRIFPAHHLLRRSDNMRYAHAVMLDQFRRRSGLAEPVMDADKFYCGREVGREQFRDR